MRCASRARNRPTSTSFSAPADTVAPPLRRFTRVELERGDGCARDLPKLIARGARVYDVSRSFARARGRHWGDHRAGRNLAGRFDARIHEAEMLARARASECWRTARRDERFGYSISRQGGCRGVDRPGRRRDVSAGVPPPPSDNRVA